MLASNITERSLRVPTERLPGGDKALVEVTVSDGLHSSKAVAGPFELPRHAPEALIYDRSGRALGPQAPAAIAQSQALELRGYGYDAEDGQIPSPSLQWTLTGATAGSWNGFRK